MDIIELEGFIEDIRYNPQIREELVTYKIEEFNSNNSKSFGLIQFNDKNYIAYSKWVSPKRTRSYPFARLYNIYGINSKRVTIIPIIKDEGADSSNNDRINAITYSWMNLLNIHIILAWYDTADRKTGGRNLITNQQFNNEWIKQKILEINSHQKSALHWNTVHFQRDFEYVFKQSVESYQKIEKRLNVKLHPAKRHLMVLEKFQTNGKFDLDKFVSYTLERSKEAKMREVKTIHELESLQEGYNASFYLRNYLGGVYHLTADEVFVENGILIIQESKNDSRGKLPKKSDILDGLFKLILYENLDELTFNGEKVKFAARLKLSGNIKGSISLPTDQQTLESFLKMNSFNSSQRSIIIALNHEAGVNNLTIRIANNKELDIIKPRKQNRHKIMEEYIGEKEDEI